MAISIFEAQDLNALVALKQFLQNLPEPKAIETVLAQAVCRCAEFNPETLDWIVDHADWLEPELYLAQWVRRLVVTRLEWQSFAEGQALSLTKPPESKPLILSLDLQTRQLLCKRTSMGEWLLLERLWACS